MNCYVISRKSMYAALVNLGVNVKKDKIPLDVSGEWNMVEVEAGYDWKKPEANLILPKVKLAPRGVANRVRVVCPACLVAEVRFGGLAQHAGTKRCQALNAVRLAAIAKEDAHAGRAEGFNVPDPMTDAAGNSFNHDTGKWESPTPPPIALTPADNPPPAPATPVRIIPYVCDRGPCSYRWDGCTGDFTGGRNRPTCPNCKEGHAKIEYRGVRQTCVSMASHEYSSNTSMDDIAKELLLADQGDPAYPLVVVVFEHAGWHLTFALVEGRVRCIGSANGSAVYAQEIEVFKEAIRFLAYDRENCSNIVRPEKETEGEKDKWMCSDNPGTGAIYTCTSMTCPVHGQRNIDNAR